MNLRQLKENIVELVALIAKMKGTDINIMVGHNKTHPEMVLVYYEPEKKEQVDVRFALINASPKGKQWDLGFCFNLSEGQEGYPCLEMEGDDLVLATARMILAYLDEGTLPPAFKGVLH